MKKVTLARGWLAILLGLVSVSGCEPEPSNAISPPTTTEGSDGATGGLADALGSLPAKGDAAMMTSPPGSSVSVALAVGPFSSCIIDDQTNVHCFGMCGPSGQGGTRNTAPAGLKARAVTVGRAFACALLAEPMDGTAVRCWGGEPAGAAPKILDATEIVAAEAHACVRNAAGAVTCWGAAEADAGAPRAAPAGLVAKELAASGSMDCAIADDDSVRCWGYRPVAPPVDLKAKRIAVSTQLADPLGGPRYGCAITLADDVRCWGDDPGGVQTVPPGTKAKEIAVGRSAACAILLDGRITCWGVSPRYGVAPPADRKATALSMAFRTAGAIFDDHAFALWGDVSEERGALPADVRAP